MLVFDHAVRVSPHTEVDVVVGENLDMALFPRVQETATGVRREPDRRFFKVSGGVVLEILERKMQELRILHKPQL